MTPTNFPEANLILAKNQPQYLPLPVNFDDAGIATSCWELTDEEIEHIKRHRVIWVQVHTFGKGFAPILPHASKPELVKPANVLGELGLSSEPGKRR